MIVLCSLLIVISFYWVIAGFTQFGFMNNGLPSTGFFPTLAGMLVFCLSISCLILYLIRSKKTQDSNTENPMISFIPKKWIPLFLIVYSGIAILIFNYVGTITAIFLICFSWTFVINRKTIAQSLLFSSIVPAAIYLIFVVWLNTPFPKGLLI